MRTYRQHCQGLRCCCLQEAIAAFVRLPISQHQTAWVMCQIGRACFEMVDFSEAAQAFTRARQLDPCRLEVPTLPCGHSFQLCFMTVVHEEEGAGEKIQAWSGMRIRSLCWDNIPPSGSVPRQLMLKQLLLL